MFPDRLIEPTKDYWLDMAALATELEKMLIKHADGHHNSPEFCRCRHNLGYCRLKSRVGRSSLDRFPKPFHFENGALIAGG